MRRFWSFVVLAAARDPLSEGEGPSPGAQRGASCRSKTGRPRGNCQLPRDGGGSFVPVLMVPVARKRTPEKSEKEHFGLHMKAPRLRSGGPRAATIRTKACAFYCRPRDSGDCLCALLRRKVGSIPCATGPLSCGSRLADTLSEGGGPSRFIFITMIRNPSKCSLVRSCL